MARRIVTFFLLVMLTFGLAAYLILGRALDELQAEHQGRQEQLHQLIAQELSNSFLLLDALIRQRTPLYRNLHQEALLALSQQETTDLAALQARLSDKAGFDIDIFLINEDLVVEQTTFTPDLGLDFKQAPFSDVRRFLERAKRQQQTLFSQPTLESSSRRYKLYSYSPLPQGGYLELGFPDPELNRYFTGFARASKLHPDAKVELFMDNWGELLVRIDDHEALPAQDKGAVMAADQQALAKEYPIFRRAIESGGVERVDAWDDQGYRSTHLYTRLLSRELEGGMKTHFLSKVTFDDRSMVRVEAHFIRFYMAVLLLAVGFMAALVFMVRYRLVVPIQSIVGAIRNGRPVDSARWHRSPELHFLAESYNQALSHNDARLSELSKLSVTDPLTGLLNRRYLEQVFANELGRTARSGKELGFAMIDVDFFKPYNDLYGHRGGDRVLKRLADLLAHQFRRAGDFVFRVGGEEFAVLVTDPGTTPLLAQFEQLRKALLAENIAHHGSLIADRLTVSIGVKVVRPGELITPEEVVDAADGALYRAKDNGRNQTQIVAAAHHSMSGGA